MSDWNPTGLFAGTAFRSYVSDLRETASFGTDSGSSADNETFDSDMASTPDSSDAPRRTDPDSIRQEPDIPDHLDLPNVFEIDAKTLKEVVDVSGLVSDHVSIEGDTDDECIRIVAKGTTDTNTATLDDELEFADVHDDVNSFLSLDYFEDAVKVIPKSATVEVRFGDEFPVMMEWDFADGHGHVEQVIAPRIVNQ